VFAENLDDRGGATMPCTDKQCGAFFDEMDRITIAPPPGTLPELGPQVTALRPLLRGRLTARAAGGQIAQPDAAQREAARVTADRLRRLFRDHFPSDTDPTRIDLECVQTCFVKFAYGELRTGVRTDPRGPAREPNGPGQFLFTEFALLALELGLDPPLWTALLRTFAKSNRVFIRAYPPQEGGPGDVIWRPREYRQPPPLTDEERRRLHEEYRQLTPDQAKARYGDTLREADGQTSVSYVPGGALDPGGMLASLHYAQLLTAVIKQAGVDPPDEAVVADRARLVEALLGLEPALGPDTMPRRHGFPGGEDEPDEYLSARYLVGAAIRTARRFVESAREARTRPQQRGPAGPRGDDQSSRE
jgi:hypothetical protein